MFRASHTIWTEQKLTRKHTKWLGTLPGRSEGIPSVWGVQQMKEKVFLDQSLLHCTARAHSGSTCLTGGIPVISCCFVFKKQSLNTIST